MSNVLVFDVETSTHNRGNPFDKRNFLVSYATLFNDKCDFKYYTDPDFREHIERQLFSCLCVVGFNVKFDIHWLRNLGITIPAHVKIWDVQLAEFIASGQSLPYDSLDEACTRYGLMRKPDAVASYWERGISTEHIPIAILDEYNRHDVESTYALFKIQRHLLDDKQQLLVTIQGEDLKTLQSAEYAGIKFDKDTATRLVVEQGGAVDAIEQELSAHLPSGIPERNLVGDKRIGFNWNSGDHLSAFLYGGDIVFDYCTTEEAVYKSGPKKGETYTRNRWFETTVSFPQLFKPVEGTEVAKTKALPPWATHFYQTDAPTLGQLKAKTSIQKQVLLLLGKRSAVAKVSEMAASMVKKVDEMNWGEFLHGNFNQNVVVTGRLSSSGPNLQNTPLDIDRLLVSRYA